MSKKVFLIILTFMSIFCLSEVSGMKVHLCHVDTESKVTTSSSDLGKKFIDNIGNISVDEYKKYQLDFYNMTMKDKINFIFGIVQSDKIFKKFNIIGDNSLKVEPEFRSKRIIDQKEIVYTGNIWNLEVVENTHEVCSNPQINNFKDSHTYYISVIYNIKKKKLSVNLAFYINLGKTTYTWGLSSTTKDFLDFNTLINQLGKPNNQFESELEWYSEKSSIHEII